MAEIRNILSVYEKADSAKKVDIIIRYYPNFLGIVDSYTEGLRYMIESEKAYNRSKSRGDLGARVQTSGKHSDITADTAISNVITRDVIIACDFLGDVLDGVDRGEGVQKEVFLLRMMRKDYELFNQQLGILDKEEAAAYFCIGEHKLRNFINENKNADYLLWNGNRVQIKRVKFEKYVDTLEAI